MQLTDSQKWLMFAVLLGLGLLFYYMGQILTPFVLGAIFAYLGDPLADQLEEKGLSRTISVLIVFTVMTIFVGLLLFVLVPIISHQITGVIKNIPHYVDSITHVALPWVEETLGVNTTELGLDNIPAMLGEHLGQAGGAVKNIFGYLGKSSGVVLGLLTNLMLIPVVTFYMLRDWDKFVAGIHHLLPRQIEPDVTRLAKQSDEMLSAFLRGQVLVMISLATIYSIGLWLVGVKFALLIGIIAGIVSFIPYMGLIVGIAIAGAAVLFQTHDPMQLLWVIGVFSVGQLIEGALLTPLLVGDRIGMHPVAVIFSVLAGGQLFGFFGILVALPVAAIIAVIVRDLHSRYMRSHLYDGIGQVLTEEDNLDDEQEKAPETTDRAAEASTPTNDDSEQTSHSSEPGNDLSSHKDKSDNSNH